MAMIYPLARPRFLPDPAMLFVGDNSQALFVDDIATPIFAAEPIAIFSFAPFAVSIAPVDDFRILTDEGVPLTDNGEVLSW